MALHRTVPGTGRRAYFAGTLAMAVPKRKTSRMRRGNRRAHDSLPQATYQEDPNTGEFVRRHHVDLKTGMYHGRQVIVQQTEEDDY